MLGENLKVRLHTEDDSHPNATGSYLAAIVFLATLWGRLPAELPAKVLGLPDGEGKLDLVVNPGEIPLLRRAALSAVASQQRD